jgi:hypothetical protein
MKPILKSLSLSTLLVSAAVFAAGDPPPAAAQPNPAAATTDTAPAPAPEHCIRETGSLIKTRPAGGCRDLAGRSYDHDALQGSGAMNAGDALHNVDPGLTVHR